VISWSEIRRKHLPDHADAILPPQISLPMLPEAVVNFCHRADDPSVTIAELARIVETDIGLSLELMRYANSCAVGLRHKVQSPQQAITALGIRSAKLILVTSAVQRAMSLRHSKLLPVRNFWYGNLERALIAKNIAWSLSVCEELAYAAGLLQDYLLPLLTNELYETYLQFTDVSKGPQHTLVEFERERFGWDHAQAGAHVMLDWCFPDDLICCVLFHHRGLSILDDAVLGRSEAAAAAVAGLMPDLLRQEPEGLARLIELEGRWPEFRLERLAHEVEQEFRKMAPAGRDYITFRHRCEKVLQAL